MSIKLARKLQATAQGDCFHGEALREALKHPAVDKYKKPTLRRYIRGNENVSDRFVLQHIAIDIIEYVFDSEAES